MKLLNINDDIDLWSRTEFRHDGWKYYFSFPTKFYYYDSPMVGTISSNLDSARVFKTIA